MLLWVKTTEHIYLIELICLHIYIIHYYSFWIISSLDIQFIFLHKSVVLFVDDNRNYSFASLAFFASIALQRKSLCISLSLFYLLLFLTDKNKWYNIDVCGRSICILFLISCIIPVPVKIFLTVPMPWLLIALGDRNLLVFPPRSVASDQQFVECFWGSHFQFGSSSFSSLGFLLIFHCQM